MCQLIRCRIGNRDAAHHAVPPKLFCVSPEVILEYWRDSILEEPFFFYSPVRSERYLERLAGFHQFSLLPGGAAGRPTFSLSHAKLPQGLLNNRGECISGCTDGIVVAVAAGEAATSSAPTANPAREEFSPAVDAEVPVNSLHVFVHRLLGQPQAHRHLFFGIAFEQAAKDLLFTR